MQELLTEILNHPTDLLALADSKDLKLIACNNNLERYLNVNGQSFQGKNIYELLGLNVSREKTALLLKQLHITNFYVDKESDPENHLSMHLVNCKNDLCCVIRVSSLKMNSALAQYDYLFRKNLAGVYKSDINGVLLSCNSAFAAILGFETPEELIGRNTREFYRYPLKRDLFIEQLKGNPILVNFELELMRQDGSVAYCLENSYMENIVGEVEKISGTLIDISEKRAFEFALQESEQRFKAISSVSNEGVVFSNNGLVADCNDQFARLLGYSTSVDIIGHELDEFISPSDLQRIRTSVGISSANRTEIRTVGLNGKTIFLEITGSYFLYRGVKTLALVVSDITTAKKVELALQQSVVSFRRLLENSPNGVVILTSDKIKYMNHSACELLGVEDEDELYDLDFLTFVTEEYRSEIKADLQEIRDGLEIDYKEIRIDSKNGHPVDVGVKSILTAYENKPSIQITLNNVSARLQLVQEQIRIRFIEEINTALKAEIDEHKRTQQKLELERRSATEQKGKLESIFNSTENLMMWTIDTVHIITAMNKNFATWMLRFFNEKVSLGDNIMTLLEKHLDEDFYQGQLQAFDNGFRGRPQQFEFPLRNKNGETTWLQAFLNPVYVDGKLEELSCLLYDNTERKDFDKKIRDSLKEKEVLLQEVHHRVKNNLQVISSILNLQASYVKDEKTLEVLRESQQRIKSMSFLHETIYRTADFNKLEFTNYLRSIVNNLVQSYRSNESRVSFVDKMKVVYLNLDQSIPCGLMVNELVSNALKYAFKGRKEGKLTISLSEKDDNIELLIRDDGVGLPDNFNYEKTDSLGIQLVYALLEQLDATVQVESKKGASFLIRFQRK